LIKEILDTNPFIEYLEKDENGRYINIYKIDNLFAVGDLFYPNVKFTKDSVYYNPYKEKVMSLQDIGDIDIDFIIPPYYTKDYTPYFFFVYNTDNYYHFVYDTLPYIISYFRMKREVPELKLLMNYPNLQKKNFFKFVEEFLDILGIDEDDIKIIDNKTLYSEIYFSNSFTHDIDSNLPPRKEIYDFYQNIVNRVKDMNPDLLNKSYPKKIYISRRTWVNNDLSNIGTNYTTRRKLHCEDDLVIGLKDYGFEEIFTESLSTVEKIILFDSVDFVIGSIGGGLCNVLFSKNDCQLVSICSPTFLDVNERFKYSFANVKTFYYKNTNHLEKGFWKKWMRVKSDDIIGEVEEIKDDSLDILYVEERVSGWNSQMEYKRINIKMEKCKALDKGLNSSWNFNLQDFFDFLKNKVL
jgi:hypothetical protein